MDFLLREDDLNIHTNMHIHKCTNMYRQIWSIFRVHICEHLLVDPCFLSFILFLHEVSIEVSQLSGEQICKKSLSWYPAKTVELGPTENFQPKQLSWCSKLSILHSSVKQLRQERSNPLNHTLTAIAIVAIELFSPPSIQHLCFCSWVIIGNLQRILVEDIRLSTMSTFLATALYDSRSDADVTLKCQGFDIKAHSLILETR